MEDEDRVLADTSWLQRLATSNICHSKNAKGWVILAGLALASPALVLPLFGLPSAPCRTGFVAVLMAFYWITEAVPIPVTALLPLLLFPLLGLVKARAVAVLYLNDSLFLLMGSFLLAIAMERWDLHKKIALKAVSSMGHSPRLIMAGFMLITAFLSMWINNTATTSLMVPIALAVLNQMRNKTQGDYTATPSAEDTLDTEKAINNDDNNNSEEMDTFIAPSERNEENPDDRRDSKDEEEGDIKRRTSSYESLSTLSVDGDTLEENNSGLAQLVDLYIKGVLLAVAYSSSIGGTSTATGSAPNVVLISQFNAMFPDAPPITFFRWMLLNFPIAIIYLTLVWLFFAFRYCPNPSAIKVDLHSIRDQYNKLGRLSWPQMVVSMGGVLMVILWITRPGLREFGIPGWMDIPIFTKDFISDGTVSMGITLLFFFIPSRVEPGQMILDWESAVKVPWGVILLIGGGYALAEGFTVSGLSKVLGESLQVLEALPVFVLLLSVSFTISFLTELTSNVATANMLLPILATISISIKQNPLLLMLSGTVSCSYAFMLPVATPPNAIVFASNQVRVMDMIKAGVLVSLLGVILLSVGTYILAPLVLDITYGELPEWAKNYSHA